MNQAQLVRNILATYSRALESFTMEESTAARFWYYYAREDIDKVARDFNVDREIVAGAYAILSVGINWNTLCRYAPEFFRAWCAGESQPTFPGYKQNVTKAWKLLSTGERSLISGPKVISFHANLLGSNRAVTIDRHAARVAYGTRSEPRFGAAQYYRLAEAYRVAADTLKGWSAPQLQSFTWTWYRTSLLETRS